MSIHALYMHEVIVLCCAGQKVKGICRSHKLKQHMSSIRTSCRCLRSLLLSILFFSYSCTSSSPVASYPDTRGTGRRVTRAVTASPMKWGVNPTLTPDISHVLTLFPPQFQALVPFQLRPQPQAVPVWARRGLHHRAALSGAIVDLPQVCFMSLLHYMHLSGILFMSSLVLRYAVKTAPPFNLYMPVQDFVFVNLTQHSGLAGFNRQFLTLFDFTVFLFSRILCFRG